MRMLVDTDLSKHVLKFVKIFPLSEKSLHLSYRLIANDQEKLRIA